MDYQKLVMGKCFEVLCISEVGYEEGWGFAVEYDNLVKVDVVKSQVAVSFKMTNLNHDLVSFSVNPFYPHKST